MDSKSRNCLLDHFGDRDSPVQRCPHCGYFNCIWATPFLDVLEDALAALAKQEEVQARVTLGVSMTHHEIPLDPLVRHKVQMA